MKIQSSLDHFHLDAESRRKFKGFYHLVVDPSQEDLLLSRQDLYLLASCSFELSLELEAHLLELSKYPYCYSSSRSMINFLLLPASLPKAIYAYPPCWNRSLEESHINPLLYLFFLWFLACFRNVSFNKFGYFACYVDSIIVKYFE